ncbi:MAG: hypothetical protein CSA07_03930 [Bacteroidia bacterium]|nr:MAG: hypothetical protein CSA07_03930 [Bacteroidia bacterium]
MQLEIEVPIPFADTFISSDISSESPSIPFFQELYRLTTHVLYRLKVSQVTLGQKHGDHVICRSILPVDMER